MLNNKGKFIVDNCIKNEEENNKKTKNKKIYIGYFTRLIISIIGLLIFFLLCLFFIKKIFDISKTKVIYYSENSDINYKVYLKDNNFYDNNYLTENKMYVASLIDKIEIDFNYKFSIEEDIVFDFTYDIIAKLSINDESTGYNYFEKDYPLVTNKKAVLNENDYYLYEKTSIDYEYYNQLANKFKQQNGIDTVSDLKVYLKINKKSDINEKNTMYVVIPLSEKSINIVLNYQEVNNSSYTNNNKKDILKTLFYVGFVIVSLLFFILFLKKTLEFIGYLSGKKNKYDKFVKKILNEYDRLIVENKSGPNFNSNIIKISSFNELLDVRDNIKQPIMYYVVSEHLKCYFYIKHENDLYLFTLKEADLEGSYEK